MLSMFQQNIFLSCKKPPKQAKKNLSNTPYQTGPLADLRGEKENHSQLLDPQGGDKGKWELSCSAACPKAQDIGVLWLPGERCLEDKRPHYVIVISNNKSSICVPFLPSLKCD